MARTKPGIVVYQHPDGSETQTVLDQDVTTLGRSATCTVELPVATVSRLHATIELQHDRYILRDAGSANGTFVNTTRIEQPCQLSSGSEIWLGSRDTTLWFSDPEETVSVSLPTEPEALLIDENAHLVSVYGIPVGLSPLEYKLLLYLASNQNTVCTREACFLVVWGQPYDHATCEDALNACVAKLRRNLRATAETVGREAPQIITVPRVGFRLDAKVSFVAPAGTAVPLQERKVGE
jgi:pSer/pThr/pTyr-binding forkhead associated (FHA) protein